MVRNAGSKAQGARHAGVPGHSIPDSVSVEALAALSATLPVIKLSMLPAASVPMPSLTAMGSMMFLMGFPVILFVMSIMVAPVMAVTGMPSGCMPATVIVVHRVMEITAAQDNRVGIVGLDGRRAAHHQTRCEQARV